MVVEFKSSIPYPEPVFRIRREKHDLFPHPADRDMLEYLSFIVSGDPENLISHCRRIHLACMQGDAENALAALLDLCVVLGSKGQSLRRDMLARCRPLLSPEHIDWLEQGFLAGVSAEDLRLPDACRLSRKLRSTLRTDAFFKTPDAGSDAGTASLVAQTKEIAGVC